MSCLEKIIHRLNPAPYMKKILFASLLSVIGWLPFPANAQLSVGTMPAGDLSEPYNLAEDDFFNIYISNSGNNRILKIDGYTQAITVLVGSAGAGYVDGPAYAAAFANPQGMIAATIGGTNGLIVADTGNGVIRFVRLSDGYVSTLAGNTNGPLFDSAIGTNATFRYPYGLTQDTNGNVYIADWGNNAIRVLNLNDPNFGIVSLTDPTFSLNRPAAVAFAGTNQLWVADTGNNMIKLITLSNPTTGSQTTYLGNRTSGFIDNPLGSNARFNGPRALLWDPNLGLLISDTGNNAIRLATTNPVFGATNYSVMTFAGTGTAGPASSTSVGALSATFNSPFGMVRDIPNGRYLLADGLNNAIRVIQYGPVLGTCPPPTIGYVTFEFDANMGQFVSVLHSDPPFVFNTDIPIGISFPQGYSAGFTLDGSSPTKSSPSPNRYHEILSTLQLPGVTISLNYNSNVVVTAFTYNTGQPSSPATNAIFHFVTGTPQIQGQNAAEFYVGCVTTNATLYYTTDGSDPRASGTNVYIAAPFNPATTLAEFKFTTNNFPFQCFARRIDATHNYADSTVASNYFSADNYKPNTITFGLTNGEPHSSFIARPGQFFYAPVTLQLTPNFGKMFSLQFNVAVTNGLANTNTGVRPPAIVNGAGIDFFSMLMSQVPELEGLYYPPTDGHWYLTIPPVTAQSDLSVGNFNYPRTVFVNTNNNLLGVGWLFRTGFIYTLEDSFGNFSLDFPTTKQDLITYSIAHDTLFTKAGGQVMVGAYSFQVPNNAVNGDQYFIQLGSPSGTADGVGAPGAGIYIQPPAVSQAVTVGSVAYLVGDAAPFHWLNAGDFGDNNLDNSDVMQVYQAAILGVDMPPLNSDLYLAMDSCGNFGISNAATGYFTDGGSYLALFPVTNTMTFDNLFITNDIFFGNLGSRLISSFTITNITITATAKLTVLTTNIVYTISSNAVPIPSSTVTNVVVNNVTFYNTNFSKLFDGSDQTINQVAFGDGNLDIADLYVTFRRSLDPSLVWFKRYWINGQFVAVTTPNLAFNTNIPSAVVSKSSGKPAPAIQSGNNSQSPSVSFVAGDAQGSAGQTVQIPITANVFGSYLLRVLGLNLTVYPLDGSPDLTQPVQFTPAAGLGAPTSGFSTSKGNDTYAATWLDSTIAGVTGNATIGTLTITLPANATSMSAYAVHFNVASGSPNGIAVFPKQTRTGLVTLSSRMNSTYNDGIPDLWRLRWFGTVNNLLSVSNACPSGDGIINWNKFVAGVDPTVANDFPTVNPKTPVPPGSITAIHWPTVSGVQYVIERSTSLFSGNWTAIATNTGTGTDMEFDDNAAGTVKFYRVLILP
jgi:hypothetical protein